MRNPNQNLRLEIAMIRGMQADDKTTVELRIEDRGSGEYLATIQLTADQWLNAQTGSSLNVNGFVSPHLDRIGKTMKHRQVPVPREVLTSYKRDEAQVEAHDWADAFVNDGESVEVRNTNAGWVAIYRWWE
jgi:primosomal replication protein N